MFPSHFQDIVESVDIDIPGKLRIGLSYRRKYRGKMKDSVNFVLPNDIVHDIDVGAVNDFKRS